MMTWNTCGAAIGRFLTNEDGPAAVEYAVMLALIIAVCTSVVGALGIEVKIVCEIVCDVLGRTPA